MCIIGDNCRQLYEYGWLIFAVKSVIDRKSLSNDQGLAFLYIFFLLPSVSGRLMYPLLTKLSNSRKCHFFNFFFFSFPNEKKTAKDFFNFLCKITFFSLQVRKVSVSVQIKKKKKKLASKNFTFFFLLLQVSNVFLCFLCFKSWFWVLLVFFFIQVEIKCRSHVNKFHQSSVRNWFPAAVEIQF